MGALPRLSFNIHRYNYCQLTYESNEPPQRIAGPRIQQEDDDFSIVTINNTMGNLRNGHVVETLGIGEIGKITSSNARSMLSDPLVEVTAEDVTRWEHVSLWLNLFNIYIYLCTIVLYSGL